MELSERKKKILRAVVESYIETAEPVGSKAVAQFPGLTSSTATIRNEMADLTELGYLEQPHTSAGRIPSPKGYRLYVNELMEEQRLSLEETNQINEALHLKIQELDNVINQAGRMVSQLTNYPAFALAEGARRLTVKRFDLILVDSASFIAVVMTDSSVVKNKLFRLPADLSEPQLQLLTTLLNTAFVGKTLDQLTPELMRMAEHAAGNSYGLISLVVSFAMEVLDGLENGGGVHRRDQPHPGPPRVPGRGQGPEADELPVGGPFPGPDAGPARFGGGRHQNPHRPGKCGRRAEGHQRGAGKL